MSAETGMNTNYDQFLDTIVELHKTMADEKLEHLAREFYNRAVACTTEQQVQAEFLYLKAIDLWMKSMNDQTPAVFTSIRAFADDLAIKNEVSGQANVISMDRARKHAAA